MFKLSDWWLRYILWNCPILMSLDRTDDKSTLAQVMVWCCQVTRHYLSQCWQSYISPYGVNRPQWAKWSKLIFLWVYSDRRHQYLIEYMRIFECAPLVFIWLKWFINTLFLYKFSEICPDDIVGQWEIWLFSHICNWAPKTNGILGITDSFDNPINGHPIQSDLRISCYSLY